jgi:hypothetical protein
VRNFAAQSQWFAEAGGDAASVMDRVQQLRAALAQHRETHRQDIAARFAEIIDDAQRQR